MDDSALNDDNDLFEEHGAKTVDEAVKMNLPNFRVWKTSRYYDYDNQVTDYESLEELNSSIQQARLALFRVMDDINTFERHEKRAKAKYARQHRREYMSASGKTEALRKAQADLRCENLENDAFIYEQARLELTRLSNTLRLELQTLQTLGNNLRQQMKME